MYIEKDRAGINMSSSDQVKEATAALKGILGIGSPVDSSTTPVKKEEQEAPKKTKKKKANKKKKKKDGASPQQDGGGGGSGKKNKGGGTKKKEATSEKFAWSAFQAPPDASSLPMPAFSPPEKTKRTLNEDTVSGLKDSSIDPPEAVANTETEEGVEAKSRTKKNGNDAHSETQTKKMESPSADEDAPVSSTGINLAALASPSSQTEPSQVSPHPSQVSPHLLPGQAPFPTNVPSPQYHPPPPPMYNTTTSPQHPVQYVTIQVQVPPTLLPDRQMVVVSPMGYPVQVRVPDGVPPGMVIPVHVPMTPPPQQPPAFNPYPYGHPLHHR